MNLYQDIINELYKINGITQKRQINKQIKRILNNNPKLLEAVNNATNFLYPDADLRTRIFCIRNNITTQPTCKTCNSIMKFNHQQNKFNEFCSNSIKNCTMVNEKIIEKRTNTLVKRYGTSDIHQVDQIVEKRKNTNLKRYGGVAPAVNDTIKQKIIETKKQKLIDDPEYVNKTIEKRAATNIKRYGRKTFGETALSEDAYNKLNNKQWLQDRLKDVSKTEVAYELNVRFARVHGACKRYNIDYVPIVNKSISLAERDLVKYILSIYNGPIALNKQDLIPPHEIDIYIPEYNLCIEYNGVFWHSELKGRLRSYHINKTKKVEEKGMRLIQIWSNEWIDKRSIVQSRLSNVLNCNEIIYARKCKIIPLNSKEEQDFFNKTHIQGYAASRVCYGLMYNGEIVASMSFSKSRFNKNYEYELLRYSNKLSSSVIGGASRLLTHFKRIHNPQSIISYSDKRWNTGNLYEKLEFTKLKDSTPNYFYFNINGDTNNLLSRQNFQKHKLSKKLNTFDSNLTEWQNMQNNGYDRIWDCGNSVWEWKK